MGDENKQVSAPAKFPTVLHVAHCIFTPDGRMVHWINDNPKGVYEALPRLFVTSIMRDVQNGSVVAGCCLFATDLEQGQADFKQKLLCIVEDVPRLKNILGEKPRTIVVQLIKPERSLSERSVQQIFMHQYIRRGVGGRG